MTKTKTTIRSKYKTTHTDFDLKRSVMTDIEMLESKHAEEVRVKTAFLESIPTDISSDNVNLETIEKFINDCYESTDYVHHMDYQTDSIIDDLRECLKEMKSRNLTVEKLKDVSSTQKYYTNTTVAPSRKESESA